ncbi:MAG: efflux RND transporter periplasmic adaptor subunit [Vicinamibacterales bacterium]
MTAATRRLAAGVLLAGAVAAAACGRSEVVAAPPAAGADAAKPAGREREIAIDAKMLASLTVEPIAEQDMTNVLAIAGKIQFDEDRLARVLVPVAGQVVDLHVKVGDPVRKGQVLCAISSREAATAVGEHIESHKDLELAEKTAAMTEDLFQHEAASRIALQQAQSDLAKARSRVARTDEALRVLGLGEEPDAAHFNGRVPIAAPIGGSVIERKVTEGQFVQSDSTPVITIADLSTVWVIGDLFERDLRLASVGQPASVTTAAYPGERFSGRVDYISEAIDPVSRTAKVRVSVANPNGRLKPEMFAAISLDVAERERVVTVPSSALFTEDGRTFVYVEASAGRFARRAVEVAPGDGPARRVLSGLRAGDRVVVDGALLLRQEEEQRAG